MLVEAAESVIRCHTENALEHHAIISREEMPIAVTMPRSVERHRANANIGCYFSTALACVSQRTNVVPIRYQLGSSQDLTLCLARARPVRTRAEILICSCFTNRARIAKRFFKDACGSQVLLLKELNRLTTVAHRTTDTDFVATLGTVKECHAELLQM